jgi:serine/threonine protein kinase
MSVTCPKCQHENPDDTTYCGKCATQLPPLKDIEVTETIEAPKEELTRGTTFAGRYEIIEELGKGGMGRVYRVEDKKLEQEVALKLIKPEIAKDKKTIERFRNELKLARNIRHKNVCGMFDLGEERGAHFITMEYVRGEDLRSLIRRIGQLPVGKSLSAAKQICEGLSEAHRLGVVHRDLKSNNIMIDKEGNVRIMDFGIARSLEAKGITGAGVMIGTPEYMSPEQVEGKEVDQRSDIYSLGIILYEMVTGRVPFEGETPFIIGVKHKSETPKDPKKINSQLPDDLTQLILKCMEKDKEQRYHDVGQVLKEIKAIEEDLATTEIEKEKPKHETEKTVLTKWKNSIAVLPFADLSPQKDQEYFCEGIAEEIINSLTKLKELRVVARTSAFSFKRRDVDVREIGKKLNVESILEGSVRKAGNRLRINAQLIHVEHDYHIWSERYDRELDDVFAIQDEITHAIVKKLKVKLFGEEKEALVKRHTDNPDAHSLYLKGRYFWNKRTEIFLKKAIEHFEKAIESDPNYGMAYAGLSDCYNLLPWYSMVPPADAHPKAKKAALKALELDNNLSEAHTSLAFAIMQYDWDWETADKEFKLALKLNSGYAAAHHWYFEFLAAMCRLDESMSEIKQAQKLDPLSLIINSALGWQFYFARYYDEAIEQCKKTLEMAPDFIWARYILAISYLKKLGPNKVIEELQKSVSRSKYHPLIVAVLGASYGMIGKKEKANELLELLEEDAKHSYVLPFYKAIVFLGLGKVDEVFEYLKKSYEGKNFWLIFLKVDPIFDSIRTDPRFKELLKKMKLDQ